MTSRCWFLLPSLGRESLELERPRPSSSLTTALESGEGSVEWPSTIAECERGSSMEWTAAPSNVSLARVFICNYAVHLCLGLRISGSCSSCFFRPRASHTSHLHHIMDLMAWNNPIARPMQAPMAIVGRKMPAGTCGDSGSTAEQA